MAIDPYVDTDDMHFNIFLQATIEIIEPYLKWSQDDFDRFFAKANISKRQVRTHIQLMKRVSHAINNQVLDLDEDDYILISKNELKTLQEK